MKARRGTVDAPSLPVEDERADRAGQRQLLHSANADVRKVRERVRRRRLIILAVIVAGPTGFMWYRFIDNRPFNPFRLPSLGDNAMLWLPPLILVLLLGGLILAMPLGNGRSPHIMYRPEQIDVSFDDVIGLGPVVEEVMRTLNVFLGYATFRNDLGGNPRRGILFEGPPGTGKTHLAKAMAREAGVPFLFVAGPSFQSMWYGMTARRIRSYFKALRKTARREGGAIGFIEEIDAFATTRGGLENATEVRGSLLGRMTNQTIASGTGGTVNELLIQMQSFDSLPMPRRIIGKFKELINAFLPPHRQLRKATPPYNNILLIAATNRADSLDPALMRPGRFDRRLYFDLPSRAGRRQLVDYFLSKKRHALELDADVRRDELAAVTFGYTPVMIEHLFDEALIWAMRSRRDAMSWDDVMRAKLTEEVGLPHPVAYTVEEKRSIATHEAGHAVVAYLVGEGRKLEILSIIKRREALGLLAHTEIEERFTKTRSELEALLKIALGGMASEEIFEGQSGTGPAGDLAAATGIAAEMVGSLGMSGSLVSYRAVNETMFDAGLVGRVLGNLDTKRAMERVLRRAKAEAKELLQSHRHLVLALRDELLERDELIGDEITRVLVEAGRRGMRGAASPGLRVAASRRQRRRA